MYKKCTICYENNKKPSDKDCQSCDDELQRLKAENEELRKIIEDNNPWNSCKNCNKDYRKALEEVRESIKNMCQDNCPDLKNGYCKGINECAQRSQKHITRLIDEVLKDEIK